MYTVWIALGLLAGCAALVWQLRRARLDRRAALLVVPLASAIGLVLAKLFYVLLLLDSTVGMFGAEALFFPDADTFSVFGGGAGAIAGAWFGAKIMKIKPAALLDCFVPCGALFLAFLRLGERELGTIGVGGYVDANSFMARFPFSVTNAYGEHLTAVFRLEALCALVCGAALLCRGKQWPEGLKTELGLFFLALPQVFCESLRARCMKWGFVRIEQLLCSLLALALIGYACHRRTSKKARRYWPLLGGFLCVAGIAALEFALDKSSIPIWLCYCLMLLDLAAWAAIFVYINPIPASTSRSFCRCPSDRG